MRCKVLSVAKLKGEYEIKVEETSGFIFFVTTRNVRYRGNSTVWREYPSGRRAHTFMEAWLADELAGAKMRGEVE